MATDLSFLGPGSQPDADDGVLEYMEMPKGMTTFHAPSLPEPEDAARYAPALALLGDLLGGLAAWTPGTTARVPIGRLDAANLAFVDQALGEGEVSIVCGAAIQAQESVLAGVWRVRMTDDAGALASDFIEIGAFPESVLQRIRAEGRTFLSIPEDLSSDVFNAPALITEIADRIASPRADEPVHAINLSLLPHTEGDLTLLDRMLGRGAATVLSRGYGNCRVMSTGVSRVWWVRFYNSQDSLILNSIEIADVPEVVCAAPEDIEDSRERLAQILDAYR